MSATLLLWLVLFALFTALAFTRPAWGGCVYMLTFFASPAMWWWGRGSIGHYRWSLAAGLIYTVAVLIGSGRQKNNQLRDLRHVRRTRLVLGLMVVNATFVHYTLASNTAISSGPYTELLKFSLLAILIIYSIRNENDLRLLIMAMVVGAGYVGFEATFNDAGYFRAGRLEGLKVPTASTSNGMANLMATLLPLTAALALAGRTLFERLTGVICGGLMANVLLMCNSRGGFLGALAATGVLLVMSPRKTRRRALGAVALGAVGVFFLLDDPRIVERFMTTFAEEEERDHSAASRLDYWQAGLMMAQDYPLGAGGDGFHDQHGTRYLRRFGHNFDARSVHNGFINELCDWGFQGLFLRLVFLFSAALAARTTAIQRSAQNDLANGMLGAAFLAGMAAFCVQSVFGDFLDNEWGFWTAGLCIGYSRIFLLKKNATARQNNAMPHPATGWMPEAQQLATSSPWPGPRPS